MYVCMYIYIYIYILKKLYEYERLRVLDLVSEKSR